MLPNSFNWLFIYKILLYGHLIYLLILSFSSKHVLQIIFFIVAGWVSSLLLIQVRACLTAAGVWPIATWAIWSRDRSIPGCHSSRLPLMFCIDAAQVDCIPCLSNRPYPLWSNPAYCILHSVFQLVFCFVLLYCLGAAARLIPAANDGIALHMPVLLEPVLTDIFNLMCLSVWGYLCVIVLLRGCCARHSSDELPVCATRTGPIGSQANGYFWSDVLEWLG